MAKRKLLFVDDEPNILAGFRRMLRPMAREFDLYFVESGEKALQLMTANEFDVVVADMRMPEMDGVELMAEVKEQHPHAIRIMLTGQADENSILRTVGVVHQLIAKPCDPKNFKELLNRVIALHRLLSDGKLKNIISRISTLPSLPSVYTRLQEKIRERDASLDDIGEIIGQDIAMAAKILQLVNSAFFGLYTAVESPARAVTLLGLDTIKALVIGLQIFSEIKITGRHFSAELLWVHSMTVGALAKKIAESETDEKQIINSSFIAGILHDIGKLILLSELESQYDDAVLLARRDHVNLRLAEKRIFQATHCDVGAYLAGLWGFPSDVIEPIGFHHQLEKYPAPTFTPALGVHVANVMYYVYHRDQLIGKMPEFNEEYLNRIGLAEKLPKWRALCLEYMDQQKMVVG